MVTNRVRVTEWACRIKPELSQTFEESELKHRPSGVPERPGWREPIRLVAVETRRKA